MKAFPNLAIAQHVGKTENTLPPWRGASAKIFELQMRYFLKSLAHNFRLVFVDGPWLSEMHDDLKPVYSHMGPCYRWANWKPHNTPMDNSGIKEIECALMNAMKRGEGECEWVGLLGFSQGTALAFSILLENQLRPERDPWATAFAGANWRFGVIMAGRAPPFSLNPITQKNHHYKSFTQPLQGREQASFSDPSLTRLRTPTLHVHGLRDGGLELHRDLLENFILLAHTRLVEWDGAYRILIRSVDIKNITEAILEVANQQNTPTKHASTAKKGIFDWLSQGYCVMDLPDERAIHGPSGDILSFMYLDASRAWPKPLDLCSTVAYNVVYTFNHVPYLIRCSLLGSPRP